MPLVLIWKCQSEQRRLARLKHFLTYEMTQKPGMLPDPRRSSSTGVSVDDGDGEDDVVVVESIENSEDVDEY